MGGKGAGLERRVDGVRGLGEEPAGLKPVQITSIDLALIGQDQRQAKHLHIYDMCLHTTWPAGTVRGRGGLEERSEHCLTSRGGRPVSPRHLVYRHNRICIDIKVSI